jgi:hypothetical protein
MLFLLFGSSASGKSTALSGVRERLSDLRVHDFDEIEIPNDVDMAWRQRTNQAWLQRAREAQTDGLDFLLAGQTPFGEVLAAPAATELEGLSACLLDCDDDVRLARIYGRGSEWLERVPGELQDHINWADWMRHHARDPAWRQDVIREAGAEEMRWERWAGWRKGDPRWNIREINTSKTPAERVVDELTNWITDERQRLRAGVHPLGAIALRQLDSELESADGSRD